MTRIGNILTAYAIAPLVPAFSYMASSLVIWGQSEITALPIVVILSYAVTLAIAVPVHALLLLLRVHSWAPYLVSGVGVAIVLQLYWHSQSVAADSNATTYWWQPWHTFLAVVVTCVCTACVFWLIAVRTSSFSLIGRDVSATGIDGRRPTSR